MMLGSCGNAAAADIGWSAGVKTGNLRGRCPSCSSDADKAAGGKGTLIEEDVCKIVVVAESAWGSEDAGPDSSFKVTFGKQDETPATAA